MAGVLRPAYAGRQQALGIRRAERRIHVSDDDFPDPRSGFMVTHFLVVSDQDRASAFLNLRVADIAACYAQWSARGAEFLTEPKDHGREIRAYIRDPDGHLIEVGQTTVRPS
jgi:catechol 2,3-dioxygenase-like lactoylglutathione lyase family enzyme